MCPDCVEFSFVLVYTVLCSIALPFIHAIPDAMFIAEVTVK